MANLSSAKKHIRSDERKRVRNRLVKTTMRTALKRARAAVDAKSDDAESRLRAAVSQLDKAAKKGVIKKQTANRRKSRLMLQHNRQTAAN